MTAPTEASGTINSLFAGMIDDYYAECDEHLVELRRHLLELEQNVEAESADAGLIFETYRRFHSLKGLSGMVSYVELEDLAHHVESFLRALREGTALLDTSSLDVIFASIQAFEDGLNLRKQENRPADMGRHIAEVKRLLPAVAPVAQDGEGSPPLSPPTPQPIPPETSSAQPPSPEQTGWQITFMPSTELQAQGINVNSVRQRLQNLGNLRQSVPVVGEGGSIAFRFLLTGVPDESAFAGWEADGLHWEPYTFAPVSPTAPTPGHSPLTPPAPVPSPATTLADAPRSPAVISTFVRVELARVDELMHMVGDLVIARAKLADAVSRMEDRSPFGEWSVLNEASQTLERKLRSLREGVMRVRLVPIGETFVRMQFVVRDLSREYGKQIRVELEGKATEIDKLIVDRLMDPLLHLVRNSVSHGLESSEARTAAGKPETGCITLRAFTEGNTVVVEVQDDGRGIDAERVGQRARQMGLIDEETSVSESTLLPIICLPGFTTKEVVDRGAGRGIGMPAVLEIVRDLGGVLALTTVPGKGTTFRITVPLTLAITDALIFSVDTLTFAMPQITVNEVAEVDMRQIVRHPGGEIIPYRGKSLRLIRLAQRFGLADSHLDERFVLVIGSKGDPVALLVDRLVGIQEIVVRTVNDPLIETPDVIGASELGDGRAVLILDSFSLIHHFSGVAHG